MDTVGCAAWYALGNVGSEPGKGNLKQMKMLLVVLVLMGQWEGLDLGI